MGKEAYKPREDPNFDGNLPMICVEGESIPEAWENSLLALYNKGIWYARQGPKDKGRLQVDSSMTITVREPNSGPIQHKYLMSTESALLEYCIEILGAKDSLVVDPFYDEAEHDTRWTYTYPGRFTTYNRGLGKGVNQLSNLIDRLAKEPWRRNNQMITWEPEKDMDSVDPPCMQRVWFFLVPIKEGVSKLNVNFHFRSRNPMHASHTNLNGEAVFQEYVRSKVEQRTEGKIKIISGRLVDINDSYHVSAQDQHDLLDFINMLTKSKERGETIKDRVYSREEVIQEMKKEAPKIVEKIAEQIRNRFSERAERQIKKLRRINEWISGNILT